MKQVIWSSILMASSILPLSLIPILHPSEHIAMLLLIIVEGILGIGVVFFIYSPDTKQQNYTGVK